MPTGLNEGNVGRSGCPGFRKSTYGSSLEKNIRNNSGNCHIVEIDQIMMALYQFFVVFFIPLAIFHDTFHDFVNIEHNLPTHPGNIIMSYPCIR